MKTTISTMDGVQYDIFFTNVFVLLKNISETFNGIDISFYDLYDNETKITQSRQFMINNIEDDMSLTIVISDTPVRLTDINIITRKQLDTNIIYYYDTNIYKQLDLKEMVSKFGYISDWDVSWVTNMNCWFNNCEKFNECINNWDVSSVRSMDNMFHGCISFNQELCKWNVSAVVSMKFMFSCASAFNQNIQSWDVSNVINAESMFSEAISFNQPIGDWIVTNMKDMRFMFEDAHNFNQNINKWKINKNANIYGMFEDAYMFNYNNLQSWNIDTSILNGICDAV
jgi:hypothetical protein